MTNELYRPKPLEWRRLTAKPLEIWVAQTPFGELAAVNHTSPPRPFWTFEGTQESGNAESVDEAKSLAEKHFHAKVLECLVSVEVKRYRIGTMTLPGGGSFGYLVEHPYGDAVRYHELVASEGG